MTAKSSIHVKQQSLAKLKLLKQFLPIAGVILVIIATGAFYLYWYGLPSAPLGDKRDLLKAGMTKKEVTVILGEPTERHYSDEHWTYRDENGVIPPVSISFDEEGRVLSISE